MKKKGVSPVIATILLIALVVIIGIIIFTWLRGMTKEAITKFDGTNIELVCEDVSFDASYSSGTLSVSNFGNVPIYSMNLKMEGFGSHDTQEIKTLSNKWNENGLNQGGVFSDSIDSSGYEEITLIPILMGVDSEGTKQTHTCDDRYGFKIFVQ